jgi:protein archease
LETARCGDCAELRDCKETRQQGVYEFFEHTADLGLRIRADEPEAIFTDAARALTNAIVENPESIQSLERTELTIVGEELALVLFDWLNELLYRFEVDHRVYGKFAVRLHAEGLEASVWGEPLDRDRHSLAHEVKAITYHELKFVREHKGWLAEVIVDI